LSEEKRTPALDEAAARDLLDRAREARRNAYAPYSNFHVGAALLARDGRVFTGVNVENASYGLGNCAERTAVFKAVSEGVHDFTAIAVVGPEDDVECTPCGACRQVLFEFGPDMALVVPDGAGVHLYTVRELLPGAFEPARLAGRGAPV
jgi:cytidine deaminase